MKKKSVFLSKVFAVALAASMAFSTPYASAALVSTSKTYEGTEGQYSKATDGFWTAWSDFYRVSDDFDVTFEFNNKGDGTNNWCNYVIGFSNAVDYAAGAPADIAGYKEYYCLRSDAFGWANGDITSFANITPEGNEVKYTFDWADWDTFVKMMTDAKISMNITRTGNDFAIKAVITGSDSKTYNYGVNFTMEADKDMNIIFSSESAEVTMLSFKDNKAGTDTTAPTDPTTPDDTTPTDPATPDDTTTPGNTDNQAPAPTDPAPTDPTTPTPDDTTPETPPVDDDDQKDDPEETNPTLSKKKLTIKVGKSKKLSVNDANGTVKWSSNKKKVAKVNKSGKVTGVKAGKATITAKVDGKTLKCTVTVKK